MKGAQSLSRESGKLRGKSLISMFFPSSSSLLNFRQGFTNNDAGGCSSSCFVAKCDISVGLIESFYDFNSTLSSLF